MMAELVDFGGPPLAHPLPHPRHDEEEERTLLAARVYSFFLSGNCTICHAFVRVFRHPGRILLIHRGML